jgi:hypothetical protein
MSFKEVAANALIHEIQGMPITGLAHWILQEMAAVIEMFVALVFSRAKVGLFFVLQEQLQIILSHSLYKPTPPFYHLIKVISTDSFK